MAINFFISDISRIGPPDYEYAIIFHPNCFVLEISHPKYLVRPPSWIDKNLGYHKNQLVQVLPYQFEPEPGLQTSNSGDEGDSEEQSAESSDEEIDHVFEANLKA